MTRACQMFLSNVKGVRHFLILKIEQGHIYFYKNSFFLELNHAFFNTTYYRNCQAKLLNKKKKKKKEF